MKRFFLSFLLLMPVLVATAQDFEWSLDANAVVNNREGGDETTPDQTFLFTTLTPQLGLSMDHGRHRIMGGVVWRQPLNGDWDEGKAVPLLHYRWSMTDSVSGRGYEVRIGQFERRVITAGQRLPYYLWSDSLGYMEPVVRGIEARWLHRHGLVEATLDWRQMQSHRRREAFDFTVHHLWQPSAGSPFFTNTFIRYNHLAKRKDAGDTEGVNDNLIVNPMLGLHFPAQEWDRFHATRHGAGEAPFALNVQAGLLLSLDRARIEHKWHAPAGFVMRASGRWRWLELEENLYAGGTQMPLYEHFGSRLYLGDQYYYNHKTYSRTDLTWHVVSRDFVDLDAKLTFHAAKGVTAFWQQVNVRFYVDAAMFKAHRRAREAGTSTVWRDDVRSVY